MQGVKKIDGCCIRVHDGAKELGGGGVLWVAGGGLESDGSTEADEGRWMSRSYGIW